MELLRVCLCIAVEPQSPSQGQSRANLPLNVFVILYLPAACSSALLAVHEALSSLQVGTPWNVTLAQTGLASTSHSSLPTHMCLPCSVPCSSGAAQQQRPAA